LREEKKGLEQGKKSVLDRITKFRSISPRKISPAQGRRPIGGINSGYNGKRVMSLGDQGDGKSSSKKAQGSSGWKKRSSSLKRHEGGEKRWCL